MKSPWKFFGQLISRDRSEETKSGPTSDDGEAKARASRMQEARVEASSSVAATDPIIQSDVNEAERVSDLPIAARATSGDEEGRAPTPGRSRAKGRASKKSARVTQTKRVPRAGQAVTKTAGEKAETAKDSFYTDVDTVDADVQRLRRQLADALNVQNAQLKQMLQRFGVS